MLNGPALLRVFLVVIAAAVLTGLVQHYWIFDTTPPEPSVARPATPGASVRRADPAPLRPAVQAAPAPAPAPSPIAVPDTRDATLVPDPRPVAAEPPAGRLPPRDPPAPARPEAAEQEIAAAEAADPRAVDLVDLNTGSLQDLNGLKGGGAIGRAIIQRRPYASTDQLLSKRVLSRAIYLRIKDQITVR